MVWDSLSSRTTLITKLRGSGTVMGKMDEIIFGYLFFRVTTIKYHQKSENNDNYRNFMILGKITHCTRL